MKGNYDLLAYQDEQAFGYWLLLQVELDIPEPVYKAMLNMTSEDELKQAIEKKLNSMNETHLHYVGDTPLDCCRNERDLEHSPVAYFRDDRMADILTEDDYLDILYNDICEAVAFKHYYPIDYEDDHYERYGKQLYRADLDIPLPEYLGMRRQIDMKKLIDIVNSSLEEKTTLRYYGDSLVEGREPTSVKALFYDTKTENTDGNLPF